MRIIRLGKWDASNPTTFGPHIEILADTIEAVEFNWDSNANTERAIVYLRGGTRIGVFQSVQQVWDIVAGAFDTRCARP